MHLHSIFGRKAALRLCWLISLGNEKWLIGLFVACLFPGRSLAMQAESGENAQRVALGSRPSSFWIPSHFYLEEGIIDLI